MYGLALLSFNTKVLPMVLVITESSPLLQTPSHHQGQWYPLPLYEVSFHQISKYPCVLYQHAGMFLICDGFISVGYNVIQTRNGVHRE